MSFSKSQKSCDCSHILKRSQKRCDYSHVYTFENLTFMTIVTNFCRLEKKYFGLEINNSKLIHFF